ncbi:double-cubane-cluster-containing anaerobic reductase [Desulfopila sp. IMCC35008]|uniref:double-cubane-cluster-containing anaerobic reductase n=1 Tax=Desulfopila sp. IMCC35008 TaxID=2653858 RepID=UPI0013D293EC|nr:double-cubane-cluster-containing anaerobic reductase [Desulfopila sp. IMCC35008]
MVLAVTETIQDVHNDFALSLEMAKEDGRKVVGCLCSYSPTELILAAGAIPVGLCGSTQEPITKAEEVLSPDQCPKVKATYGRAISGTCPIFPLADCVIAETTCDGRKKMYELLEREVPMYVMDLPQKPETPAALDHWVEEVRQAKSFLEQQLGVTITHDHLREAIVKGNKRRKLITDLYYCRVHHPGPINGFEFINTMSKLQYYTDFDHHIETLERFHAELHNLVEKKEYAHSADQPRILWTGLGNSLGCSKVLEIVEECGGVVVCQEGCGGVTRSEDQIHLHGNEDPLVAIAKRYLRVTCACMTPNNQRFEDLERLTGEFQIDGVIDLAWQFCQPFEIESYRVRELVKDKLGLPFLHVVTDYSHSDTEQLRIRIEGFMEQIATRKRYAL